MAQQLFDAGRSVAVLGAGIVGTSCALHLQARGWDVTLIDRKPPGRETSYGNAGVISRASFVPINTPRILRNLHRFALNRSAAVQYDPVYLARNIRWIGHFLGSATRASCDRRAAALAPLSRAAPEAHKQFLADTGMMHALRDTGWLKVFRSHAGFENGTYERALMQRHGVEIELLDAEGISALEPCLNPVFARGLLIRSAYSVDDPGAVTASYGELFRRRGGQLLQRWIVGLRPTGQGFAVDLEGGAQATRHVVVALGPWSRDLLTPLGYRIPLAYERGYHRHFQPTGNAILSRPIHDVEAGYAMTATSRGIRLTSGVELAERDSPPTPRQLTAVEPRAREALPFGQSVEAEPWMGARPSLPDGMPMIGPAARHKGLWFAFGHGHIGFGTGPISGRILAELMSDETPALDTSPFRPARFN